MLTEPASQDSNPRHLAIVMDGNGRWARARHLPRTEGHRRGVSAARKIIAYCAERGVEVLTLFAFSSENWRRPQSEVSALMELFVSALKREIANLAEKGICIRFIGDRSAFNARLQEAMAKAEQRTRDNIKMTLVIAANYGGRWDITQAAQGFQSADSSISQYDSEAGLADRLSTAGLPDPDLFIRTGGEHRLSNFLLWQLAYTELYFTDVLWPDFTPEALDKAFDNYKQRQRRFGRTSEQVDAHV